MLSKSHCVADFDDRYLSFMEFKSPFLDVYFLQYIYTVGSVTGKAGCPMCCGTSGRRKSRQNQLTHVPFAEINLILEMWANAQRDGRHAEYSWRPLLNAAVWLTPTTRVPCSNAAKTQTR